MLTRANPFCNYIFVGGILFSHWVFGVRGGGVVCLFPHCRLITHWRFLYIGNFIMFMIFHGLFINSNVHILTNTPKHKFNAQPGQEFLACC